MLRNVCMNHTAIVLQWKSLIFIDGNLSLVWFKILIIINNILVIYLLDYEYIFTIYENALHGYYLNVSIAKHSNNSGTTQINLTKKNSVDQNTINDLVLV